MEISYCSIVACFCNVRGNRITQRKLKIGTREQGKHDKTKTNQNRINQNTIHVVHYELTMNHEGAS